MKPSEYLSKNRILPKFSNYSFKETPKRLIKENILKFETNQILIFIFKKMSVIFMIPQKVFLPTPPFHFLGESKPCFLKPLCDGNDIIPLIREFEKEHGTKNIYVGMDEITAKFLEAEGFRVNEIGKNLLFL